MNQSILCIKNAVIVDKHSKYHLQKKNIYIDNERIVHIGNDINADVVEIDFNGDYISSGWMDLHAHVNPSVSIGLSPDEVGVLQGVTTVVDAGSCGTSNIDEFINSLNQYKTKVRLFLNISSLGLTTLSELADSKYIKMDENNEAIKKYNDTIVGIKVRASKSVMHENMSEPFEYARQLADENDLPIMVHIGNAPPTLDHVLPFLHENDIVTHCFHGKPNKVVKGNDVVESVIEARRRGVKFDIGHGSASFNFFTYKDAIKNGLGFETISSDLHQGNIAGPVYSLSKVMDKMIALLMPFDDVVDRVTYQVAKIINLADYGQIKEGYIADLTRFKLEKSVSNSLDAENNELQTQVSFKPISVFVDGKEVKCHE